MIQWCWPESHGENKHVVMFGGLHIEMALWNPLEISLMGQGGLQLYVMLELPVLGQLIHF